MSQSPWLWLGAAIGLIALVVGATRLTNRRLESTPPYASFPDVADSGGRD